MPAPVGEVGLSFLFWLPSNRLLPQCSRSTQDIMVTNTGKVPATRLEYCRMFWGCSVGQVKPSLSIWRLSQDHSGHGTRSRVELEGGGPCVAGPKCPRVAPPQQANHILLSLISEWWQQQAQDPGLRSRQHSWWGHGCFGVLSHLLLWASG